MHRNLEVWKQAVDLVLEIYRALEKFPPREKYNLSDQMRRSVISIPSNIAEGAGRTSPKEKLHFWNIARGSLSELDTELEIAHRLGYLASDLYGRLREKEEGIGRMLSGLMRTKSFNRSKIG